MRIIKLQAENIKRLKAIEITPEGDLVIISGKNGQGKSSVLDAMWYALGGAAAQKGVTKPIREGQLAASVTVDLGPIKVTRNWIDDKTTLRVETADGARYPSQQAVLDDLVGRLSFDPWAFANQSPKEQINTLLEVAPIGIDLDEVDQARRDTYEKRTEVNREARRIEGALSELSPYDSNAGLDLVDVGALVAEFREAERLERDHNDLMRRIGEKEDLIANLKSQLDAAQLVLGHLRETKTAPIPDVRFLEDRLDTADTVNKAVENNRRRMMLADELDDAKDTSESLTQAIDSYDRAKEKAIRDAKMPVRGLSFDDQGVIFNGIPFAQVNPAEQLKISVSIAMALNPKLRVIRIDDGSLLDSDNLKIIREMAHDNDFQIWLSVVDGKDGIVIEDGMVKE